MFRKNRHGFRERLNPSYELKALHGNPSYSAAYRCLASAFAHLGRDAEAHEAAARVLETDPTFTISAWIARGAQSNAKLLIEGLRKAGLPD
jgi:adenylate cyclase